MASSEFHRIAEIDRSERIAHEYRARGRILELVDVERHAARWGEPSEPTVRELMDSWAPLIEARGRLLGAFDGDRLVAFAIYASSDQVERIAALYVTATHRRRGIGRMLTDRIVDIARAMGARRLYVSATPTRATVDFYRREGFEPLATPNARLLALEPDDIHMERTL